MKKIKIYAETLEQLNFTFLYVANLPGFLQPYSRRLVHSWLMQETMIINEETHKSIAQE